MSTKIFVYGTLMEGMVNHAFLENSKKVKDAEIEGFDMYFLGHYPGVIKGSGRIKGEIYEVSADVLKRLDEFEGEGYLYVKRNVQATTGEDVLLYVYNQSIDNKPQIAYEMQPYNKLVYYVSYGSNMLEERFMTYIKGGRCRFNGVTYKPCRNTNNPIISLPIEIPYNMYFSKKSNSWNQISVCFLDVSEPGFAYGRAYLVTEEQFKDIQRQEGLKWYENEVELNSINGIKAKTFTNFQNLEHKSVDKVGKEYLQVLISGLQETHGLSDEKVKEYLCI